MIGRPGVVASGSGAVAISGNADTVSTTYIDTQWQILGESPVPVTVAAKDPEPIYAAVAVKEFTGRRWLTAEVDGFFASNQSGYVFVEADAGLGKTAFAAWLVKERGYLSHFSRYSDGRLTRAALQNLSAQLIIKCGLGEYAPGGMLPDWAQTPAGFESLLGLAAHRVRGEASRLVIVVDGLDEAAHVRDSLPFGLPSLLPHGAYIIGTYRTGNAPIPPDAPAVTLQIGQTDQRNRADIRQFLNRAAGEEVLAARLAEAKIEPAAFVDRLAEACDGIWIYLRYVLHELRIGLRPPNAIGELPAKLRDYYISQIQRWRHDPAWDKALLPLLATLAVAGEPLPISTLARLAGDLDFAAVRRWCDLTIRPLLTTSRSRADRPLEYEIYHASFREVLKGPHGNEAAWPDCEPPYQSVAAADELHQAAIAAHGRVAKAYLNHFGGLNAGLLRLAKDPAIAQIDGGYPLRHLARHLIHCGMAAEVHLLLATECSLSTDDAVNVWFTAHDRADCIASFLGDLSRARADSAQATDQALARNDSCPSLGQEVRYALIRASITSRAKNISPQLLEQAVRTRLWSPGRGLDHARRLTDPVRRMEALIAIYPHLTADEQPSVLDEALTAVAAISDSDAQAEALAALAPQLPPSLMAEALTAATAISDSDAQAEALAALAPQLPPSLIAEALAAATAISDSYSLAQLLTALAPYLSPPLTSTAFAAAVNIADSYSLAQVLASLAPRAPADARPEILVRALTASSGITDGYSQSRALTALAPLLPADEQRGVLDRALTAASGITDGYSQSRALTALAPLLPADEQREVLDRALTTASGVTDGDLRADALAALAPYLPPSLVAEAWAAAAAIPEGDALARALAALAPHLPASLMAEAWATAIAIPQTSTQAEALAALAPYLPPSLVAEALAAATAMPDSDAQAGALAALAPYLPPSLVAEALAAATAIPDGRPRARLLTALASHLPTEARQAALTQAIVAATNITDGSLIAEALTALAPYLPVEDRGSVLSDAVAVINEITDSQMRMEALTALAPYLPVEDRGSVLSDAVAVINEITDSQMRIEAAVSLAPHLAGKERRDLLNQAVVSITDISDGYVRIEAAVSLAPHLAGKERRDLLNQALVSITDINEGRLRARAAITLAPHLSSSLVSEALATATKMTDEFFHAEALATHARRLPDGDRSSALVSALADVLGSTDNDIRVRALTALVPHLSTEERASVLAQALEAATAIVDNDIRVQALTALVPHLSTEERASVLAQALEAATAIPDDYARAETLSALAPHLPPALLAAALDAATAIDSSFSRAHALAGLAPHLPISLLAKAVTASPKASTVTLRAILQRARVVLDPEDAGVFMRLLRTGIEGTDRSICLNVIAEAAPAMAEIGGVTAIEVCARAVCDVHRWWP